MCGIAGVYHFKESTFNNEQALHNACQSLSKRGPDKQAIFSHGRCGLAHARLSILDVSDAGSQPMSDASGRYTIVFNGEIYNYRELQQKHLADKGIQFVSTSDTEVLLYLYIHLGEQFLKELNGFFALAIYDNQTETLLLARDRMGIKPLLVYQDEEQMVFGSELKALMSFSIKRELNVSALKLYLQLNYVPPPLTILQGIYKVSAGSYMLLSSNGEVEKEQFYTIPDDFRKKPYSGSYDNAKADLVEKLEESVRKRLIADVPLGAFLSGGIDSSVLVSLATRHSPNINTFSIGYADEPFFDETHYAELVANKFQTNHTTFSLKNDDLYGHLFDILDYFDEPFADSSAIAVYILCNHTRKKATVALSGDGADEMFSGYNKHLAAYRASKRNLLNTGMKLAKPLFAALPKSRNSKAGNFFRQLDRYATGVSLSPQERYWRWCGFVEEADAIGLLTPEIKTILLNDHVAEDVKSDILKKLGAGNTVGDTLYADMHLVLQGDMLVKVDMMSMANSLEVRVPFLDHEVVNFAFSLPDEYKIGGGFRKRILKDAFRDVLPEELYNRPKHGFEVPLLKWFRTDLRPLIEDDLLADAFVKEQGVFDVQEIKKLKEKLFSSDPGEVHAQIWALIVFQWWWRKYMTGNNETTN